MLTLDNPTYQEAYKYACDKYLEANGGVANGSNKGRYYLAGPMTGLPQFNFPTFDAASTDLRKQGYIILSPAEMDDSKARTAALASPDGKSYKETGHTWADYLKRDLFIVCEADGIIVLPGWYRSSGAQLETFVAMQLGKPVYGVYPKLEELSPDDHPYQRTNAKVHGLAHAAFQKRMEKHLQTVED